MTNHSFLSGDFYHNHAELLCMSYQQYTRQPLLSQALLQDTLIESLFSAPFALVSHGTEPDPIFNFGNQTALSLFEVTWGNFTRLPSRQSAEPVNQEERQRLLERVTQYGYIDDYSGVRISSTGKRFLIKKALVWNLIDQQGQYQGQAAVFDQWTFFHDITTG